MISKFSRSITQSSSSSSLLRCFSSSGNITIDLGCAFKTHLCEPPLNKAETNKDELIEYLKVMYTMRRMEITCDNEYKDRRIRGFCHLYDGQEAVATGLNAALTKEDSIITSYRCHTYALLRGKSVAEVFGELFGFSKGATKGKGGSMHFYNKSHNFYGGQGIVGAQIPVGVGLAFANKYNTPEGGKSNVALAIYGDGAANQGQIWEAANMASLWKLPAIFVIENNQYGMGTSTNRSSSNSKYYTMGNHIPGMKVDGMNVLAVREAMKQVREFCASGNGPFYLELDTYRYHGHSMSDPGITYRTRDEVGQVRTTRDPIELVKKLLIDHSFSTEEELKDIEKSIRDSVQASLAQAKADAPPADSELLTEIYATKDGKTEMPPFVRMPDYYNSYGVAK